MSAGRGMALWASDFDGEVDDLAFSFAERVYVCNNI